MAKKRLSHEELLALVKYDAETGEFVRLVSAKGTKAGTVVGSLHCQGYREGSIGSVRFLLHRLAFFYVTGEMISDDLDVDHVDGDRSNNAYNNLRVVSRSKNLQNQSTLGQPKGTSGHLGVCFHRGSGLWYSSVVFPGTRKQLRHYHKSKESAAIDAIALRKEYYPGFTGRDLGEPTIHTNQH